MNGPQKMAEQNTMIALLVWVLKYMSIYILMAKPVFRGFYFS